MSQSLAFSRRASSASTASRMNLARPYVPAMASIRSMTDSGSRTCVALLPSAGRPMRGAVGDTVMSGKLIKNDTVCVDALSDTDYIDGIENRGKAMTFQLDTSGYVAMGSEHGARFAGINMAWSDLSPFAQGYVEAMPWRDADGLPLGYALEQDRDGDWTLTGPLHVVLFSEPGEGLLIGTCDRATAVADALAAITEAAGFSDLAPETLARIIADCEQYQAAHKDALNGRDGPRRPDATPENDGRMFWHWRNKPGAIGYSPLTVQLGDDGKVVLA